MDLNYLFRFSYLAAFAPVRYLCLFMILTVIVASGSPGSQNPDHVVIRAVANMYREPNLDTEVVSQAIYGTNLSAIESSGEWMKVRTADDYVGWMKADCLRHIEGRPYATNGTIIRVAQLSANIYRETDVTKRAPVITVPWDTRLEVIEDHVGGNRWLKLRLPDDQEAYIQRGDISSEFTPLNIDETIALAKKFIGLTYTWGGTSSFGYDCSGYMQMLIRQRGKTMPRDASLQAVWEGSAAVDRRQLQPGDLLYFGDTPEKVTHTGMYIGNDEFIHDTTSNNPMVQISTLADAHWTKIFISARRIK
jgi:gamma-D-glutamyl-L-lysine dipeptidyl-peptidase